MIKCFAFNKSKTLLYSGSTDGKIKIWDMAKVVIIISEIYSFFNIYIYCWQTLGNIYQTRGYLTHWRYWFTRRFNQILDLGSHESAIIGVCTGDGDILYSVSENSVKVWNTKVTKHFSRNIDPIGKYQNSWFPNDWISKLLLLPWNE